MVSLHLFCFVVHNDLSLSCLTKNSPERQDCENIGFSGFSVLKFEVIRCLRDQIGGWCFVWLWWKVSLAMSSCWHMSSRLVRSSMIISLVCVGLLPSGIDVMSMMGYAVAMVGSALSKVSRLRETNEYP